MALGDVQARAGRLPMESAYGVGGGGGAALGRALQGLSQTLGNIGNDRVQLAQAMQTRENTKQNFAAQRDFIRLSGALEVQMKDLQRALPADGSGYTVAVDQLYQKKGKEFLATLTPPLREKMAPRVETIAVSAAAYAYKVEHTQGDAAALTDLNGILNTFTTEVVKNPLATGAAVTQFTDLLNASALPDAVKADLQKSAERQFLTARFSGELQQYRAVGKGIVGPADGKDIVAAGLSGWERALLNYIAAPESGGKYNVRYSSGGGKTFTGGQHPNISEPTKGGSRSSAAGRYQFLYSTWVEVAQGMGVDPKDFSPQNQDRGAIAYAKKMYNARTGRNLEADMQSGDRGLLKFIRGDLAKTWEGLQSKSGDNFANYMLGSQGLQQGPKTPPGAPDPFADPAYASLTLEDKLKFEAAANSETSKLLGQQSLQAKAMRSAQADELLRRVNNGSGSIAEINAATDVGILTATQEQTFIRSYERVNKAATEQARVEGKIASGLPLTAKDTLGLNAAFAPTLGDMAKQSTDAVDNGLVPLAIRAGQVPTSAVQLMETMSASADPKAMAYGLSSLAKLQEAAPVAYDKIKLPKETQRLVDFFQVQTKYNSDPTAVAERVAFMRDPNTAQARDVLRKQAQEISAGFTEDMALKQFSSFFSGTDAPIDSMSRVTLLADRTKLFDANFILTQNEAQANELTDMQMARVWAPTEIGGAQRLQAYGPDTFPQVPSIDGTKVWIDAQIRVELGLGQDAQFQLVADAATEQQGNTGQPPSYYIAKLDAQGLPSMVMAKDSAGNDIPGKLYRYAPILSADDRERLQVIARLAPFYHTKITPADPKIPGDRFTRGPADKTSQIVDELRSQLYTGAKLNHNYAIQLGGTGFIGPMQGPRPPRGPFKLGSKTTAGANMRWLFSPFPRVGK